MADFGAVPDGRDNTEAFEKQSGMAESKYMFQRENTSFKGLNFHLGQQLLDKVKGSQ